MYVVGVDTGGTRSRCIVVDESFSVLGTGEAGPGNYRVAGVDEARENVETAVREALSAAGIDESTYLVGGFGMGTLDSDEDRKTISNFLREIECIDEYHITNDVVAAYYSFTAGRPGVIVIAGTGAMAFGQNESGESARASGWGWLFGDEGSGFDVAKRGLQAASKAYDGRGEQTDLVTAATEHFDLESFEEVFTGVYDDIDHAKDIASFAKPVAESAASGDDIAMDIIRDASDELANAAAAVIDRLSLAPAPTVACQGGFGSSDIVSAQFESSLTGIYPRTEFVEPINNSVVGSIAYVVEQRDGDISQKDLRALDAEIDALDAF